MWWLILLILIIIAAFAIPRFGVALLTTVFVLIVVGAVLIYQSDRRGRIERAAA